MGLQLEHILACIRSRRGKEKRDAVVNGLASSPAKRRPGGQTRRRDAPEQV